MANPGAFCLSWCSRNLRLKMTDIVMLAMGIGFFIIALAYVAACDRL